MSGEVWPGSPLRESCHGHPLTHDILERLGALRPENYRGREQFRENLNQIEQELRANEAGWIQILPSSSEGLVEMDQLATLIEIPQTRPRFDRLQEFGHSTSDQFVLSQTLLSSAVPMVHDQNVNFIGRHTSPVSVENIPSRILHQHPSSRNLSACLPARDWAAEEDFWHAYTALVPESIQLN